MRSAYALLGFLFLFLIVGAVFFAGREASAPIIDSNNNSTMALTLTSSAFEPGGSIPSKYTCDGDNVNPPLSISGVPEGTQSLVLLMDDPDIPQVFKDQRNIDSFDHWTLYGIPPDTTEIQEGKVVGSTGRNSAGNSAYTGPCPPTEYEPTEHRYIFRLFALSGTLNFVKAPSKAEVEQALDGMILEQTELIGVYDRANKR